jgi:hypothetical protein
MQPLRRESERAEAHYGGAEEGRVSDDLFEVRPYQPPFGESSATVRPEAASALEGKKRSSDLCPFHFGDSLELSKHPPARENVNASAIRHRPAFSFQNGKLNKNQPGRNACFASALRSLFHPLVIVSAFFRDIIDLPQDIGGLEHAHSRAELAEARGVVIKADFTRHAFLGMPEEFRLAHADHVNVRLHLRTFDRKLRDFRQTGQKSAANPMGVSVFFRPQNNKKNM